MRFVYGLLVSLLFSGVGNVRAQLVEATEPLRVVMNLAAHPDDEDGQTLAFYRHAENAVTYSVIFTRGEGGQNEIGPELYEQLGAIRTEETERAARILGTQVFFLNFKDFGYSKSAEETFEAWGGRDEVVARLVYFIRKLKPDVLFTNHDTLTTGQHGHHQAVGIAAYEAFSLASDAQYRPEQLEEAGIDLWQPKRLFVRYWREPESFDVAIPVGHIHQITGTTYGQIAMDALREHASQGMELFTRRERPPFTFFYLLRSATDEPLEPHDLAGNLPLNETAQPGLMHWIDSDRLFPVPEGTLEVSDSIAVPGQRISATLHRDQFHQGALFWRFTGAVDTSVVIPAGEEATIRLRIPAEALPTVPRSKWQYKRFVNHPPIAYVLHPHGSTEIIGAGYLPLEIAPHVDLRVPVEVVQLRPGLIDFPVSGRIYDPAASGVHLNATVYDDGRRMLLNRQHFIPSGPQRLLDTSVSLELPDTLASGDFTIRLSALPDAFSAGTSPLHLYHPGRAIEVEVPQNLRVGVIQSYDNTLDLALRAIDVDHVLLDSMDLAIRDLDDLHTIVIDIRAYMVRPDLRTHNDRLLAWVRRGGHLIVNYHKTFEWNPDQVDPFAPGRTNPADLAPYPLVLGRGRVTREDAPVDVLVPEHVMFRRPNPITHQDWAGWVQERGLYFPMQYDERYQELLSMNDPGEEPLRGSTLFAAYGEGTYLYTALSWYRQLKMLHPGAFRLFANMISVPLVDGRDIADAAGR